MKGGHLLPASFRPLQCFFSSRFRHTARRSPAACSLADFDSALSSLFPLSLPLVLSNLALIFPPLLKKKKKNSAESIASVATKTPELSTLLAAVKAANLTDKLSNSTLTTTLFAPTDKAFAAYLAKNNLTSEQLLASPDLKWILKQHFVKKAAIKVRKRERELFPLSFFESFLERRAFVAVAAGAPLLLDSGRGADAPFFPDLFHCALRGVGDADVDAEKEATRRRRGCFCLLPFFPRSSHNTLPKKMNMKKIKSSAVLRAHQRGHRQVVAPQGQPHHRPLRPRRRRRQDRLGRRRESHQGRRARRRRRRPRRRRRARADARGDQGGPRSRRGVEGQESGGAVGGAAPPGRAHLRRARAFSKAEG